MLHILCLHGKQQSAEILRTRFGRLPHKARNVAKFTFADAPHLLEVRAGDDAATRQWYVRDGNARVPETLEVSLAYLEDMWRKDGPFHGIFGFSMGGCLTAVMATMPMRFPGLKFVIVGGAPDIAADLLVALDSCEIPETIRSLHLIGLADNVIPPPMSKALADRFHAPQIIEHEQGHCIPTRAAMLDIYVKFLQEMAVLPDLNQSVARTDAVADMTETADAPAPGSSSLAHSVSSPSTDVPRVISDEIALLQSEEIEVMCSIYPPEELKVLTPPPTQAGQPTAVCRVLLSPGYGSSEAPDVWSGNLGLQFTLHPCYPLQGSCPPTIEIYTGSLSLSNFPIAYRRDLLRCVQASAAATCEDRGEMCLMQCVQVASEWLGDAKWKTLNTASSGTVSKSMSEGFNDIGDNEQLTRLAAGNSMQHAAILAAPVTTDTTDEVSEDQVAAWVKLATLEASQAAAQAKVQSSVSCTNGGDGETRTGFKNDAYGVTPVMDTSSVHVSASARGVWEYTVGLVGKPSAGKSTFYNAVTRAALDARGYRHMAEVAPHPFTTIEPNIAPGWYASFHDDGCVVGNEGDVRSSLHGRWEVYTDTKLASNDVSDTNGDKEASWNPSKMLCNASPSYQHRRVLPLIIKDVAGLVPGAYKGRGKGNRFLSDLCDADVLVHVVDVTGQADRDGNIICAAAEANTCGHDGIHLTANEDDSKYAVSNMRAKPTLGSTPSEDAEWIRHELHRWIFNNIKAKWSSVGRKGDNKCMPRVVALFSGYKGPSWNVELAAQRAGLDLNVATSWNELDIHRLVAHYLCIRFPICLALNKCDDLDDVATTTGDSNGNPSVVSTCQQEALARGEIAVPVSARAECWALQKMSRNFHTRYQKSLPPLGSREWDEEERRLSKCISGYGGTGVLEAISEAVKLKPPVLCYPVGDIDAETPVAWTHAMVDGAVPVANLRDCVQLKPGSTVDDVYTALKRGALPNSAVHGDFVRAEGRGLDRKLKKIQLRRDAVLSEQTCVIRVMTNRKAVWQSGKLTEDKHLDNL